MFVYCFRMNKTDDLYYVEAIRKGNVQVFSVLVEKYQNMVYSLALKLMKKPEEAEELAQDTFIKAYQKIDSYEGKSKFSTWLYSITYNACISELRKRRIEFASLDDRQISDQDEMKMHDYYRETKKEDQEKYRQERAQEIIAAYCNASGLVDSTAFQRNPAATDVLIAKLWIRAGCPSENRSTSGCYI